MRTTGKSERADADVRLYYRPREVAQLTGLGLRTIYSNVYAGIIPSRKIGDARLIPAPWLPAHTDEEAETIRQACTPPPQRKSAKKR